MDDDEKKDEKDKKDESSEQDKKKNKKDSQGESFWHAFVRGIPGIGSGREYVEKMNGGDYWGASAALGMFTFDLFTFGSSTIEKTVIEGSTNAGTKLITQFSEKSIDEAVDLVMNDTKKVSHIFTDEHVFEPLVEKFGGQKNLLKAILQAANGKFPTNSHYDNVIIKIAGKSIVVGGKIINGVLRVGTIYVKK